MTSYAEIIHLAQIDPLASVKQNGDYSINITNNVKVKKGDNIIMKNAFLDTSAFDTQQIIFDTDIRLEFDFSTYVMHNITFDNTTPGQPLWTGVTGKTGFPLFEVVKTLLNPNLEIVTDIVFYKLIDGKYNPNWGNITTTIQYRTWDGTLTSMHFKIPPISELGKDIYTVQGLQIHATLNSLKDITPASVALKGHYNSAITNYVFGERPAVQMQPKIRKFSTILSKGIYQPSEVASVITEKLQSARAGDTIFKGDALDAPFLINYISQPADHSMACAGPSTYQVTVAPDTFKPYPVDLKMGTTGYWAGASQMALEYDSEINKFYWSFLHTPSYGGVAGALDSISITVEAQEPNIPGFVYPQFPTSDRSKFYNQQGGGVIFQSLRAYDTNEKLIDFWDGLLGFDLSSLCFQHIYTVIDYFPDPSGAALFAKWNYPSYTNFISGQTVTTPEIIADMGIIKGVDYQKGGSLGPSLPTNTDKVYASNQVLEANLSTGFYFIDCVAEFQNSITDSNNTFKNTIGIVSNYFNQNSFTTGSSADTLIYTHNSDTEIVLSSFQIRILDSLRNNPDNLGINNHIFIEVQHNPSPFDLLLEQTKAEGEVKELEGAEKK